jgi:hypothetical protein
MNVRKRENIDRTIQRQAADRHRRPATLERFSITLNRQRSRFSLILRMILSEESATFRDHVLMRNDKRFGVNLLFLAFGLASQLISRREDTLYGHAPVQRQGGLWMGTGWLLPAGPIAVAAIGVLAGEPLAA